MQNVFIYRIINDVGNVSNECVCLDLETVEYTSIKLKRKINIYTTVLITIMKLWKCLHNVVYIQNNIYITVQQLGMHNITITFIYVSYVDAQ